NNRIKCVKIYLKNHCQIRLKGLYSSSSLVPFTGDDKLRQEAESSEGFLPLAIFSGQPSAVSRQHECCLLAADG
ncbi:MAG TPA: hypothetical protein VIQ24_06805, partial [Pyrinomonadaceae bacterium]